MQLSGTALKILQSNAEQAELKRDVIEYNSKVAAAKKIRRSKLCKNIRQLLRRTRQTCSIGYISQCWYKFINNETMVVLLHAIMPKIPTFEADTFPTEQFQLLNLIYKFHQKIVHLQQLYYQQLKMLKNII